MNKICVYAICKNESAFVERWLDSMQEADYIVVLDTGSSDDTFEKLKNDKRVTRVEQKIINPWRFDVARNESMKLVPDDANILVCTDFDEIFEPNWADTIKNQWISTKHNRGCYLYAFSHTDNGYPTDIFTNDKIHTRDFQWKFPVHEVLFPINVDYLSYETLNFGDKVFLHHFPDKEKERSYYFDLLKLRSDENPNDYLTQYLLAREYGLKEDYDQAIIEFNKLINMGRYVRVDNVALVSAYGLLGDIYKIKKDLGKAIEYYTKAIICDKTYRDAYLCIAEIYNEFGLYESAKAMIKDAIKNTYQQFDWAERATTWAEKPYDILSVAEYYLNNINDGIIYAEKALEFSPNDERIQKNYQALLNKNK